MRRKQRVQRTQPDGTAVHPVGQERFIDIQKYVGDLPSDEPVDWFAQSDERDEFLIGTDDTKPDDNR